MQILVIGRTGQVARALSDAAARRGISLATVGRPEVDLLDYASVDRALDRARPSLVINAAAYTSVDQAETDQALAFAINADAVGQLGQMCARASLPTIHVSTDYVFDGEQQEPYTEADIPRPINVYGASKLAGEEQLRQANERHLIVRTSWVFSETGQNFVKTMLRLGAERPVVRVVDDQWGSPTYAAHLADALLDISMRLLKPGCSDLWGTYHATGEGYTTWCRFADEVFSSRRALGLPTAELLPITTGEFAARAKRPLSSRLDCRLLAERFGVCLPPWQVGVRECLGRLIGSECRPIT